MVLHQHKQLSWIVAYLGGCRNGCTLKLVQRRRDSVRFCGRSCLAQSCTQGNGMIHIFWGHTMRCGSQCARRCSMTMCVYSVICAYASYKHRAVVVRTQSHGESIPGEVRFMSCVARRLKELLPEAASPARRWASPLPGALLSGSCTSCASSRHTCRHSICQSL